MRGAVTRRAMSRLHPLSTELDVEGSTSRRSTDPSSRLISSADGHDCPRPALPTLDQSAFTSAMPWLDRSPSLYA